MIVLETELVLFKIFFKPNYLGIVKEIIESVISNETNCIYIHLQVIVLIIITFVLKSSTGI